jgi:hypothetical protein
MSIDAEEITEKDKRAHPYPNHHSEAKNKEIRKSAMKTPMSLMYM